MNAAHTLDDLERLAAEAAATPELDPRIPREATKFLDKYIVHPIAPSWRAVIGAFYAEGYDPAALETVCGFREANPAGYSLMEVVAGRRAGKTETAAGTGTFEAVVRGHEHARYLAPGQVGVVAVLGKVQKQGLEIFRFARGIVERNPELAALLDGEPLESLTGGELRFKNGISLVVMPASKSSVRGFSIVGAVLDELAFVAGDDESANQDKEILSAIRFGMLSPKGAPTRRLTIISSPAAKSGVVYDLYREHFGSPNAPILVAHGATQIWNPSIDPAILEAERARDPKAYTREVLAEFCDAISGWIDADAVRAAASWEGKPRDAVPWLAGNFKYFGGIDMAFKRDRSVLAIGHYERVLTARERELGTVQPGDLRTPPPVARTAAEREGRVPPEMIKPAPKKKIPAVFVVDGVWAWTPKPGAPLDADMVAREMAEITAAYGIKKLTADQFAIVPLTDIFKKYGVRLDELTANSFSKYSAFSKLREAIYLKDISLPGDEELLRELCELQERISGASVKIGAPERETAHDDRAHALAWLYETACSSRSQSVVGVGDASFMKFVEY